MNIHLNPSDIIVPYPLPSWKRIAKPTRVRVCNVRHARWSMCRNSSAHDHESPLLHVAVPLLRTRVLCDSDRAFLWSRLKVWDLKKYVLRVTPCLPRIPFSPVEWEPSLPGTGGGEGNFRAHFDNISRRLLMSPMLYNKWTRNLENWEIFNVFSLFSQEYMNTIDRFDISNIARMTRGMKKSVLKLVMEI